MLWYKGELELARAAKAAGIPFTLATGSQTSMEEVAKVVGGTLWFQLYMWSDVRMSHILVERAKNAGFEALVVNGGRTCRHQSRVQHPQWLHRSVFLQQEEHHRGDGEARLVLRRAHALLDVRRHADARELSGGNDREIHPRLHGGAQAKNDSLGWTDLKVLRDMWPGKLLVKGILTPKDAELAIAHGADGVIVSNHGGRNFDSSMAPIDFFWGIPPFFI